MNFGLRLSVWLLQWDVSTVVALSAMHSSAELVARDQYILANSAMKDFPTEPNGARNRFNFQCTTSPYALFIWSVRVAQSTLPQENEGSAMGDGLGREGGGGGSDREDAGRGGTAGDLN